MGHSSLVGTTQAPQRPQGRDEDALGPADLSDSGSDMQGANTLPEADPGEPVDVTLGRDEAVAPIEGTNEDADDLAAADIGVDRIIEAEAVDDLEALDENEEPTAGRADRERRRRHTTQP